MENLTELSISLRNGGCMNEQTSQHSNVYWCERLIQDLQTAAADNISGDLIGSLPCRAWFKKGHPLLYHKIFKVTNGKVDLSSRKISGVVGAMDSPSVQSSSKCSASDFSIKRILGDSRSSEEDCTDSPSWLCCTRYQPPRLPRTNNVSSGRARRSGRHARVPFTGAQAAALEAAYSRAPYLAPPALRALAAALQLRDDRIKIWFQNRRARERREKNGNVTPPSAVTLQPTQSRIPVQQDLSQLWNGLNYPLSESTPITYRQTSINNPRHTLVSTDMTSASSYPPSFCNKQPFSEISENLSNFDSNRCESPLDIETVDT